MQRKQNTHKGQNGKVMIIGGSEMFHGAPILCSLGAEYSGADLVFPVVPPNLVPIIRTYSLNMIVQSFEGPILTSKDVKKLLSFSEKMADVVVIGPGLGGDPKTKAAIKKFLANVKVPTVIDASALIYTSSLPKVAVLTPHAGEFKNLTGDEATEENVQKWAKQMKATMVVKGQADIISDGSHTALNKTGNALMTVGGTGDVLAGLIGGLMAQGLNPKEAGKEGVKILGRAADKLSKIQGSVRAIDLAHAIPALLK